MTAQAFMFEPKYTEEEVEERFQGEEVLHDNGLAPSTEVSRVGRRDWCTCLRCEMILTDFISMRMTVYRQAVHWIYGRLRKFNCIPLPSCVINAIRKRYPEQDVNTYEGFHECDAED